MSGKSIIKKSTQVLKAKRAGSQEAAWNDARIDEAVADDPDWSELQSIDWSKAELVIPPKKHAISIRLDEDLIEFFKSEGQGYQSRINAVLRSYMREMKGR